MPLARLRRLELPKTLEIIFLGTGTSHGIPMIGCDCPVCTSSDPRDKRNRTSVAVQLPAEPPTNGRVILIDTPPELRLAAVANAIRHVEAILITHAHADHIVGMDDVRRYNNIANGTIPCYANLLAEQTLRTMFAYADRPYLHPHVPSLGFRVITEPTRICGVTVQPVPLMHGKRTILGFRIGRFAYCTDCSGIPAESMAMLADLDLLVLDALRFTPHPAHFNLEQALAVVERLQPKRALLTHIAHEIGHAEVSATLPDGVELAIDGMRVTAGL